MAEGREDPEPEGLRRTIKDLSAGAAGGVAQVLLGQLLLLLSRRFVISNKIIFIIHPRLSSSSPFDSW